MYVCVRVSEALELELQKVWAVMWGGWASNQSCLSLLINQPPTGLFHSPFLSFLKSNVQQTIPAQSRDFLWPKIPMFVAQSDAHFCLCWEKFPKSLEELRRQTWFVLFHFPLNTYGIKCFLLHLFIFCLYMCVHLLQVSVEVIGQPVRVGSLFPPCETWGLNSGRQIWYRAPLPAEFSC